MNKSQKLAFSQTLVTLAVAAAFTPAHAQVPPGIPALPDPGTYVSIGAGYVSGDDKDRARFGQYNGLREHNGAAPSATSTPTRRPAAGGRRRAATSASTIAKSASSCGSLATGT